MHVGPPKPTEVEANKVTSTSAMITWKLDLPNIHRHTALKCKVQYLPKGGGIEKETEPESVSENPMSILVDGLDPCTEYEYSVKIDMKGLLSSSETLTFTTSKLIIM